MTFDELIKIQNESHNADLQRRNYSKAEEILRELRKTETTIGGVLKQLQLRYYAPGQIAHNTFIEVLNEVLVDTMMIAEMRIRAKARAEGLRSRTLAKQVSGFMGDPADKPKAEAQA